MFQGFQKHLIRVRPPKDNIFYFQLDNIFKKISIRFAKHSRAMFNMFRHELWGRYFKI